MFRELLFCCFSLLIALNNALHLPESLKPYVCKRSEINYSECAKKGIQDAMPIIVKGIKELNIPPLDPLFIEKYTLDRKFGEDIEINAVVENIEIHGIKDVIIEHLRIDPYKYKVEGRVIIPSLRVSTDYDIKGKFLSSPINSQGHFEGNFTDVQAVGRATFNLIEKDGEKYLQTRKLDYKFAIGDGKIEVTTKDPGMQTTADFAVHMFNENPRGIINSLVPIIMEYSREEARKNLDEALIQIPAREFFPDE